MEKPFEDNYGYIWRNTWRKMYRLGFNVTLANVRLVAKDICKHECGFPTDISFKKLAEGLYKEYMEYNMQADFERCWKEEEEELKNNPPDPDDLPFFTIG